MRPVIGESELDFWRRRLFERLAYIIFIATSVMVLPSALGGFFFGAPFVGVFDIIVYLCAAFLYLKRDLSMRYRHLIIELVFMVGIAILLALGPFGAGFIWLFSYCLFCTILFGQKGSKRSFFFLSLCLLAMGMLIQFKVFENINLHRYSLPSFVIISINFLGLVYMVNYSFAYIIHKLEATLTEQKKSAQRFEEKSLALENANRELDNLIYSISHDIRSPLANIQGLSGLGLMDSENEVLTGYFKRIHTSATKLQDFTEQITNFFKADKASIQLSNVHLHHFVHQVLDDLLNTHESLFDVDNQIDESIYVKTDPTRLGLIITNILTNAIKYQSPSRKLAIQISSRVNAAVVELSILDNGIGIKEELLQTVFEIFTRATTSSKGSGLGLYIVKQCCTNIGAQIEVESKEGAFTQFTLMLPKEHLT